uniref:Uncharacterized protein n=1 Tax=Pavo cristatus TaxID=9049 RepID=A0A8C9G3U4_PAVCR
MVSESALRNRTDWLGTLADGDWNRSPREDRFPEARGALRFLGRAAARLRAGGARLRGGPGRARAASGPRPAATAATALTQRRCTVLYLVSHHTAGFESQQAYNMNRLNTLPRGFGSLPALEVLDLTYNNLNENSLPGNFFYLTTLRALYLSDNDFEILPPDIGKLTKLQIVSNLSKFLENQFTFAMLVGIESSQFEK